MMQFSSTDDDEALARMLQQEEEDIRRSPGAGAHRSDPQETVQELRDLELARQFAQMEMQDGVPPPSAAALRQRSSTYDAAFDVSDFATAGGELLHQQQVHSATSPSSSSSSSRAALRRSSHADFSSALSSPEDLRRVSSLEQNFPPDIPSSRNNPPSSEQQDPLAYARQLQVQAFSNIRREAAAAAAAAGGTTTNNEASDLELARRIQQGLTGSTRSMGEDLDLELARRIQHGLAGSGGSDSRDSDLELARRIQQGLSDGGGGSQDADLAMAHRMQELENFGMGRMNSERGLNVFGSSPSGVGRSAGTNAAIAAASSASQFEAFGDLGGSSGGGAPGTAVAVPPDHMRGGTVDERLARFMEATGRSMRDISSDELNNLLGQVRPHRPSRQRSMDDNAMETVREIHVEPTERPAVRVLTGSAQAPVSPNRRPSGVGAGGTATYTQSAPTTPTRSRTSGDTDLKNEEDDLVDASNVKPIGDGAEPNKKKKGMGFLGRFTGGERKPTPSAAAAGVPDKLPPTGGRVCIPAAIPPAHMLGQGGIPSAIPPMGPLGNPRTGPHAGSYPQNHREFPASRGGTSPCVVCGLSSGTFVVALGQKYHPDCFRCAACHERIDVLEPFAVSRDAYGRKQGYHRKCFAEIVGARCVVCRQTIPANADGTVSFVKHPFFDSEQMCPRHATDHGRRCTGCHRFEPYDDPFVSLSDGDRCVCYACARSVIMSSTDAAPLWKQVLGFMEHKLGLPIWDGMRDIPVLIVGANELNEQLSIANSPHSGSTQIMTRGLCLTLHEQRNSRLRFKMPSMRFNQSSSSFEALDGVTDGFTYYEVPRAPTSTSTSNVVAIMCLSGLPKDLTASVLAHEALHAWVKLHPQFESRLPLPVQVEEGCAQLLSMLFLNDGLDDPQPLQSGEPGPSDAKLRQYFRFCIETDDSEIYGAGYRQAAVAYREIGIEALLMHIVRYRDFPVVK